MATHGLYGVFYIYQGVPTWAMLRSRKRAIKGARFHKGTVRRMSLPAGSGAWDAHTFHACSTEISDFREADPFGGKVG